MDSFPIQTLIHCFGFIIVHTKLLEPWLLNDDSKFSFRAITLQGPAQESSNGDRHEIELIVKHSNNTRTKRTRYFIQWEGWGQEYNM